MTSDRAVPDADPAQPARPYVAVPVGPDDRAGAYDPRGAADRRPHWNAQTATDFVRFCYRRRRVSWPELYDEMCAVAASGTFRGWSYVELAEEGISFTLPELPRLAALAHRVADEERGRRPAPGVADAPADAP